MSLAAPWRPRPSAGCGSHQPVEMVSTSHLDDLKQLRERERGGGRGRGRERGGGGGWRE